MKKIIGIGNALTDILAVLKDDSLFGELNIPKGSTQFIEKEQVPEVNKLFSTMKTAKVPGGSTANTIRALAQIGVSTGFVGKIGHDATGEFYVNNMQTMGIDTKFKYSELPSGIASTLISSDGERTFIDYLGAAATLKSSDITPDLLKGYSYFFVEGYLVQDHDMIEHAMKIAKENNIKVCIDMANFNIVEAHLDCFKKLIREYVDIIFANEQEAMAYSSSNVENALDELGENCEIVVVKVGSKGSYILHQGEKIKVDALSVDQVIDTTSAGDYYAAGFIYGLLNDCSMEKCGRMGSLFSSETIRVIGTALSDEQWESIRMRAQKIIAE